MKYCPSCGKSGIEGMKFCPKCGQRLTDFDSELKQPEVKQEDVYEPEAPPRRSGMRIAAGILLVVLGMVLLISFVSVLIDYGGYGLDFDLFAILAGVFIVTGGVFCLIRKVWGLCLASGLVTVFMGILGVAGGMMRSSRIHWLWLSVMLAGIISTILISSTKREWRKSQA
jgi:hypothetical protein